MNRSCPCCADTSAAARELIAGMPTWSTITSVSFFCPHAFVYVLSNQVSYAGTKWLHCRILSVRCAARARLVTTNGAAPAAIPAAPIARMNRRRPGSIAVAATGVAIFSSVLLVSSVMFPPAKRSPGAPSKAASDCDGAYGDHDRARRAPLPSANLDGLRQVVLIHAAVSSSGGASEERAAAQQRNLGRGTAAARDHDRTEPPVRYVDGEGRMSLIRSCAR